MNKKKLIDKILNVGIKHSNSVLVNGFWRSGTTFLMEMLSKKLGAKYVFEPLDTSAELLTTQQIIFSYYSSFESTESKVFFPFSENHIERTSSLFKTLNHSLRGDVYGKRITPINKALNDVLKRKIVLKSVRCHLALNGISNTFNIPVIIIHRDPRSVLASLKRNDWGGKWIKSLSLKNELLSKNDGRIKYFQQMKDLISYYDRFPKYKRAIAYWGFITKYIVDLKNEDFIQIDYNSFAEKPNEILNKIFMARQHFKIFRNYKEYVPNNFESFTTNEKRFGLDLNSRLFSWKNELSLKEINFVEEMVRKLSLESKINDN